MLCQSILSSFLAIQVVLATPVSQDYAECSPSYNGAVVKDASGKFDWGWENGKSCKKFTSDAGQEQGDSNIPQPSSEINCYSGEMGDDFLKLLNDERSHKKLGRVKLNDKLHSVAQAHSELQASHNLIGHAQSFPNEAGLLDRIKDAQYEAYYARENVAWNQKTMDELVKAWMHSPGHKSAMLDSSVTEIGFGCAVKDNGPYYTLILSFPAQQRTK